MPRYYNEENGIIVDYPEDAAALFPVLKLVPSEREIDELRDDAVQEEDEPVTVEVKDTAPVRSNKRNGES